MDTKNTAQSLTGNYQGGQKEEEVCPCCGYCPKCGRKNPWMYPTYPYYTSPYYIGDIVNSPYTVTCTTYNS